MATKLTKPIKTQIANKSTLNQVKNLTLVYDLIMSNSKFIKQERTRNQT